MRQIRQVLAVMIALLLLLTGCRMTFSFSGTETTAAAETQSLPQTATTFAEIHYLRPDMDALRTQFEKSISMHTDGTKLDALLDELERCYELYCDFYTMDTIAELRSYIDVSDDFYADETAFCLEAEAEVDQLFEQLMIAGANCEYADKLEERFWGEGLIGSYGGVSGEMYDDEYVALAQREAELIMQYRAELADATVCFRGEETLYRELTEDKTLSDSELNEIDTLYYDKYAPILGEIYIELVEVRQTLAAYLGYDSYEDYAYEWVYERDYTPQQAQMLIEDIRTWIAPLYQKLNVKGAWDEVSYEPMTEAELIAQLDAAIKQTTGSVYDIFAFMKEHGLYDIGISEKKADFSYQTYLDSYDWPFILVKTYGFSDDILAISHEFGHFVDSFRNSNATYSIELSEVFSQGMEYLVLCRLPEEQRSELQKIKLLDTLDTYAQQASFAEFEHQVYAIPAKELTAEKLNEISLQTAKDFGYSSEEYEDYYAKSWIDIAHLFEYPFYVISYCASVDPAFQIYQMELEEQGTGLRQFNLLLPRNHSGFLETLETQSKLQSPFAADRMKETAQVIEALLKE